MKNDSKILSVVEWFSLIAAVVIFAISLTGMTIAPGLNVIAAYLLIQWFVIIVARIISGTISRPKA